MASRWPVLAWRQVPPRPVRVAARLRRPARPMSLVPREPPGPDRQHGERPSIGTTVSATPTGTWTWGRAMLLMKSGREITRQRRRQRRHHPRSSSIGVIVSRYSECSALTHDGAGSRRRGLESSSQNRYQQQIKPLCARALVRCLLHVRHSPAGRILVNHTRFHHEIHLTGDVDVGEGIAGHRDQIRDLALCDHPDIIEV